jgi:hypothetical protein
LIVHVLIGSPVPLAAQWVAAALLFGGGLAAVAVRQRGWRIVATALAVCGLGGTLTAWVAAAVQPGAPPYSLRIASPVNGARAASPLTLTVCGVRTDSSTLPATDAAHYLVVFVDGHEVPTVDEWQFAETVAPGTHVIKVELVTPAHHAFNPPATATTTVAIVTDAPAVIPANC